ncbi:MAG: SPOR domain-containing protein [Cryomorphaceae bacterium]|jgi:alpha-glucuronidase|nr:SPOR domain-containing protein [Cryomorphaceae bacterium]MDG1888820.1 SPOR domain-containing protein [Flavobacteriaceae bacterium]MBT3503381.1 SPOR domain-containing protein [Cryomorphaceae bacterium]MBT3688887.1 SPOR domain-containing protein [Cryomorphaceae bacterium]MBT4222619.1 SPOR domain-containing protein [Cryomorphaceae bacterium]
MIRVKFSITLVLIILSNSFMNAQDESVVYNDTVTQKLFQIKKDYSKRIFESTYYTIQIYFGSLKIADSILNDFKETFKEIKSELIFETPNYKVRIGEFKDINIASQKLEGFRRKYPGSFIIKLSEL